MASKSMRRAPDGAFALMVDPVRFPALFTGYGPVPSIQCVVLEMPLAVGATRRIHNSDGTVLTECVTSLDPPNHHGYTLAGFTAPFSWLVSKGHADWHVIAENGGSRVQWRYDFTLAKAWLCPATWLLLKIFMARAMQRCLDNMARALDATPKQGAGP